MIRVSEFHKAYDQTIAVRGLDFEVQPGQILGLIGPNGAGKTTTLRAIAGILTPSSGQLEVAGFDIQREAIEAKRRLSYIPDDPQLFHDLTVAQHLDFAAAAYRVPEPQPTIDRLLQEFQLEDKRHTPVSDLSRGMKQKLAVSAAYLHEPRAILFDEPLTGLDPRGIRALKNSICQRAKEGAAVMISSHLLAMVEDICSHVLIVNKGRQMFFGPIATVRDHFADSEAKSLEEIFLKATEAIDELQAAVTTKATLEAEEDEASRLEVEGAVQEAS